MGVEPTRDRAERPPSRFEDGVAHRDPYTSIALLYCPMGREACQASFPSCHFPISYSHRLQNTPNTLHGDLGEILYHQISLV